MPELPEVETVRKGLEQSIIGQKIIKIKVNRAKTIDNISVEKFKTELEGEEFNEIKRKAKYLFLETKSGKIISVHLKMSGAFLVQKPETELPKHTHVIFDLHGGKQLRFKDLRAFGRMGLYNNWKDACDKGAVPDLAPEPLEKEFTVSYFEKELKNFTSPIKAVLLDQKKVVSGIGNIYADESLFLSGIRPNRPANQINKKESAKLYHAIKKVISDSIEAGGTSIRDYVNAEGNLGDYALQLWVYGQKKKNCKICNTPIEYIRLAQRGTHFCPQCQV